MSTILAAVDAASRPEPDAHGDARPQRCDEAGNNCHCINIVSLGQVAHYGAQGGSADNTNAFQDYLNTKSNGLLTVFQKQTAITADFLSNYDVVILQALQDSQHAPVWKYTQSEIDALADWVKKGGALIALTGYSDDTNEVTPTNQLLAFSGISINTDDTYVSCPDNYCYCRDSALTFSDWNQSAGEIVSHLTAVGVFHGRSVSCSGDCTTMATGEDGKSKVGVMKIVESGRVFVWGDEWITYTSQWFGSDQWKSQENCKGHTADVLFNLPQFWSNIFRWLTPDASCFQINDPDVPIQLIL